MITKKTNIKLYFVAGYQNELDNCLSLIVSFQLKSLFIQAFKRKLARSSVILIQYYYSKDKEKIKSRQEITDVMLNKVKNIAT